jgi:hypothetical protein
MLASIDGESCGLPKGTRVKLTIRAEGCARARPALPRFMVLRRRSAMTRSDRLPTVAAPRSPPGETAATHLRKRLPTFGDERSGVHRGLRLPWRSEKERDQAPEGAVKSHMAVPQVPDAELVEAFIGQEDRYAHSGLKLGDCISRTAFDLVFRYGSVLQRSAVRQALIACISLPAINHLSSRSVRHNTFEKHLDNLLVHVLRTIALTALLRGMTEIFLAFWSKRQGTDRECRSREATTTVWRT